jgi:hypothetical protein
MSEYNPPTEDLPIFDVTVFRDIAPYDEYYLKRQGLATSVATETSFSGLVNFNNLATPPHCSATPTNPNDLANKAYVDALAPQTSYIVYLNYSQTFTTSTPSIYKKLSPVTNNTPTLVPFHTVNTTPLLIAGFFNTKADLKFANSIPAGLWNLILYANCQAVNDQNHLGLNFVLYGVTAGGVETIIESSAYSPLINVLSPLIGTYSCVLTVTNAIDITAYDQVGIKVYALSNTSAGRDGSIYFQYPSYYSALQTSFATTQASDITITNNTWTGVNTFSNTTNLNTTILQGTGTIQFPDLSVQSTAFKSLVSGIYTNSNITVDAQGAISTISTGVGGANAETIDLTLTTSGTGYQVPYSTTSGLVSTMLSGGLIYNRDTNTLAVSATDASNLIGGLAGQIPYQSALSTTLFTAVGISGQVLRSNGVGAPSWTTNIIGTAGSASAVSLTSDNTNGDYVIPFSKTTGAVTNTLYIDPTTTPFTYNPNLARLSAQAYTTGDKSTVNNTVSLQTSSQIVHTNNAPSGGYSFYLNDATPTPIQALNLNSVSCDTLVPLKIVSTVSGATPSLTVKDSVSTNSLLIIPSASAGTQNPMTVLDDNLITASGVVDTETLTLTTQSTTTSGIRIQPNAVMLGSGGFVATPTTNMSISGSAGTIALTSTTCPSASGYVVPAGSDNSTKIATTAWVQTAIPLATTALANNLTNGVVGNVLYQTSPGLTTRMVNGTSGTVLTSGGVGSVPSWSANLAGNAGSATAVNLTVATLGSGEFIPISQTGSGNSTLRTNASLTYNHGTNTITANVTGTSSSADIATSLAGGVVGNLNYQQNTGLTAQLVNGTSGTVLTSGGVGFIPSWSANLAGNAGSATYATNTTVTNDVASATYHALTFTSNVTGNLPQKTRANVSTGAGLTYTPSTNVLNVNASGVGAINTGKLQLTNATSGLSEITNTAGTLNISNSLASSTVLLQTADAGGVVATRVNVGLADTEIMNKLQTTAGIIGPATLLTFTSDMIGYNVKKNGTSVDFNVVSGTIYNLHASGTNGVALVGGVYMVTLYSNFQPPNVVGGGLIAFSTTGISTDGATPYTYVGGTGAISTSGSATLPANSGLRVSGGLCTTMVVPTGGATYYQLVNMSYATFTTMNCFASACFFHATRIA